MDKLEQLFGKAPKEGYEFNAVDVQVVDNDRFKGLKISWSAKGIGFGEVNMMWGIGKDIKAKWPKQYGFHTDTELMSKEFVDALMVEAAPKIARIIVHNDRSDT
jgi:hypothetical protein